MIKKDKRGFLLAEETLKIVLAVIVIGFLVYLLASLYFSNQEARELKFADSSAKRLTEDLNLKNPEAQIFNPEGWAITSWKKGNMPLSCSNLNWEICICLCKKQSDFFGLIKNTAFDNCNKKSSCLEYSKEIFIKEGSIFIENPPITLEINYGDKITISRK